MLLAVDTSTKFMGLAIHDGAQIIGEVMWHTQNHHTVELTVAIRDLLQRCDIPTDALRALAVAIGPGSFTGLRIGMAAVKGMALSLRLPAIGVFTMDILAFAQPVDETPLITILQAGRARMAMGWYRNDHHQWQLRGEPQLVTIEELAIEIVEPVLVCGELNSDNRQYLKRHCKKAVLAPPARSVRRPSYLAEIAWQRLKKNETDDIVTLAPYYLRTEAIPVQ